MRLLQSAAVAGTICQAAALNPGACTHHQYDHSHIMSYSQHIIVNIYIYYYYYIHTYSYIFSMAQERTLNILEPGTEPLRKRQGRNRQEPNRRLLQRKRSGTEPVPYFQCYCKVITSWKFLNSLLESSYRETTSLS